MLQVYVGIFSSRKVRCVNLPNRRLLTQQAMHVEIYKNSSVISGNNQTSSQWDCQVINVATPSIES